MGFPKLGEPDGFPHLVAPPFVSWVVDQMLEEHFPMVEDPHPMMS